MSDTILIFDIDENLDKNIIVEKSEKDIYYENLKKDNLLEYYHYDSFRYIEDFNEKITLNNTTINSILLQQLYPYIIPIVEHIGKDISNLEIKKVKIMGVDYFCIFNNLLHETFVSKGIGCFIRVRSNNNRLPVKLRKIFSKLKPALNAGSTAGGPIICDDQYPLHGGAT